VPDISPQVDVRLAKLDDPIDQQVILDLLDMYARDPMGDAAPLSDEVRSNLLPGLQGQPQCRVFLAWSGDRPLGLAICFLGFSTFRAQPLLNIHDLAVLPESRGLGVGRALLAAVEQEARRCGCCRLTLEVRLDNHRARRLYQRFGFETGNGNPDAFAFWKKTLS
jgi:ribosomal protein S18 acetylase RimI-like enzyme